MLKYFKYFQYVIIHKWYVMVECFKKGLIWQGLVHDMSKFLPSEFFAYAEYFYGSGKNLIDFDYAWLYHQRKEKHHWQFWILKYDDGDLKVLEMPDKYIKELVADWSGAGKAQGHNKPHELQEWYIKNHNKIILHPITRSKVEQLLLTF